MDEIIYLQFNNWFSGRNYPREEPFIEWVAKRKLCDDEWCKEQGICVNVEPIDMSVNYIVAAPKSWVEENCPMLLTDESYTYTVNSKRGDEIEWRQEEHTRRYSDFVVKPDEDGEYHPWYDAKMVMEFVPGVHWIEEGE